MQAQLQRGQVVTANAFGGKHPRVVVLEDRGDVVLICGPQEFERATEENRQPLFIGLSRSDLRSSEHSDEAAE